MEQFEERIALVLQACGLGEPGAIKQAGGTRNLTFIVTTESGRWAVRRRYAGYCHPDRLAFDHSAASWLAERGAAVVAPVRTPQGETFVVVHALAAATGSRTEAARRTLRLHATEATDVPHAPAAPLRSATEATGVDEIWEVYPLVDGRHLLDGDARDCAALGSALAQFHQAGDSFEGRFDKLGPRGETDPHHLLETADRIIEEGGDCAQAVEAYRQAVLDAAAELTADAYLALPHTLVHGDVQPANIVMSEGDPGVAAFLDLDWIAWRPAIYDLSFAVLCCCAGHERPLGEGDVWAISQMPVLRPEPVRALLDSYRPLSGAEKAALPPQMMLCLCHIRLGNSLKLPPAERRAFLERPPVDDLGDIERALKALLG